MTFRGLIKYLAEREELEPFIKQIEIIICKCNASALQMLDYIYFM